MTTPNNQGPATRIIHNRRHKDAFGSPYSPVYNTTTYRFENTADLLDVIEGRSDGNLYTRWGTNPSIQELEPRPLHKRIQEQVLPHADCDEQS